MLLTVIRAVFWGSFSARTRHAEQLATNTEAITAATTNRPLTSHLHSRSGPDAGGSRRTALSTNLVVGFGGKCGGCNPAAWMSRCQAPGDDAGRVTARGGVGQSNPGYVSDTRPI